MIQDYRSIFLATLAEFESPIVPKDQGNQGKGQLLLRTGYKINLTLNNNIGYLKKNPGQTQHAGVAVDALFDRTDGTGADFITDEAIPGDPEERRLIKVVFTPYSVPPAQSLPMEGWIEPTAAYLAVPGPMRLRGSAPAPAPPPSSGQRGSAELVAQVKADLVARGVDLRGACGAFRILNEVGRRCYPTYGLLQKAGGNRAVPRPDGSCKSGEQDSSPAGYATDYLIERATHYGFDILGDGGGANAPQWGAPETAPDMVARNRANWAEVLLDWPPAEAIPPGPGPEPPPPPPPPPDPTFPDESTLPMVWSPSGHEFGSFAWMAEMGVVLSYGYHVLLHRPKDNPTDFLGALNWLTHIVIFKQDPAFVWAAIRTSGEYKQVHGLPQ